MSWSTDVSVVSGTSSTGNDFGNFRGGTIRGQKFKDADAGGDKDVGESGLMGWEIHLFGTDGQGNAVHEHDTTDANGDYSFSVLPGSYTVVEGAVAGWKLGSLTCSNGNAYTRSIATDTGTRPATLGLVARAYNEVGQHQKAKQLCEDALAQLSDEHREYVSLFMVLELQLVLAQGGLGDTAGALERIDAQLERFAGCDHPLLAGMLHDARARLCWAKGDVAGFERSLAEVEREFRRTGVSALVAHAERLALLARPRTPANTQEEGALRSSSRRPPRPTTGELSEVATVVAPKAATRARS